MEAAQARMPAGEEVVGRAASMMWWKTIDCGREEEAAEERVWREETRLGLDASTGRSWLRQATLQ